MTSVPVNVEHVGVAQQQVTENVEQRLNLQSLRIDIVTESVQKAQRAAEDNAELLQNLLVGVENMGENLKKFREEFQNAEREHEAINEELLTEVPLSVPAVPEPIQIPFTPVSAPQFPVNPTVLSTIFLLGLRQTLNFEICRDGYQQFVSRVQGHLFHQYQGFSRDLILGKTGNQMYHQLLKWDL